MVKVFTPWLIADPSIRGLFTLLFDKSRSNETYWLKPFSLEDLDAYLPSNQVPPRGMTWSESELVVQIFADTIMF